MFFSICFVLNQIFSKNLLVVSVFVTKTALMFFLSKISFICFHHRSLSNKECCESIDISIFFHFGIFSKVLKILYKLSSATKKNFIFYILGYLLNYSI